VGAIFERKESGTFFENLLLVELTGILRYAPRRVLAYSSQEKLLK